MTVRARYGRPCWSGDSVLIYRPARPVNGSGDIGRGTMPPSRDLLSRLPYLTRGERCRLFLSLRLQFQPWPRLGVGDKEKIQTPNLDGGGWRALAQQTAQTPPCYWSAWAEDHHRYGVCLASIQPTVHDVLCHLVLSVFRRLLPTRLDERFLSLRRGLSTCHFGRLAANRLQPQTLSPSALGRKVIHPQFISQLPTIHHCLRGREV